MEDSGGFGLFYRVTGGCCLYRWGVRRMCDGKVCESQGEEDINRATWDI